MAKASPTSEFQSTLPRGSDKTFLSSSFPWQYFNPRSLAGATLVKIFGIFIITTFQSTLPRGSDTSLSPVALRPEGISIHAPSRERPMTGQSRNSSTEHFNPRSLAGATMIGLINVATRAFQSTLPRGSDKVVENKTFRHEKISIHAPSRERPMSALI